MNAYSTLAYIGFRRLDKRGINDPDQATTTLHYIHHVVEHIDPYSDEERDHEPKVNHLLAQPVFTSNQLSYENSSEESGSWSNAETRARIQSIRREEPKQGFYPRHHFQLPQVPKLNYAYSKNTCFPLQSEKLERDLFNSYGYTRARHSL
jgi:hypothetical protein